MLYANVVEFVYPTLSKTVTDTELLPSFGRSNVVL